MQPIPELQRHCGSWIIVDRATGRSVFETFERATAERVNQDKYEVLTALQWLIRFNNSVRPITRS